MNRPLVLVALAAAAASATAADSRTPYAGQESRDIKALSPAEISDLLSGRGMGYAKAAELNGYPGPAHVLELADELRLSAGQRRQSRAIFERMAASAREVGAELVEAEQALDASFRDRRVTPEALSRSLGELAGLQARLRNIHLQAHHNPGRA